MRMKRRAALPLLFLAFALSACGGGINDSRPAATGNVSIALTDAPSYAFDNVWVTVRAVWFHKVDTAPFDNTATGWIRFTLDNGATVNLAALTGDNNVKPVFDNLALPAGTYRQILLFLEPTENARTPSATDNGLLFNNQVDAGSLHAALRVPNAAQGIRLAGTFTVAKDALLRLAIDFDIARDVLPFDRGAVKEFLLQPRLSSFDLGNAGAIVGFIDNTAASDNTALFEVLAEQIVTVSGLPTHVVRRTAAVDNATGKFVLYPLVPGTIGVQRYDIVIRGIGRRTAIVQSVPVTGGTTPASGATILGTAPSPIPMAPAAAPDFRIAAAIVATTGAMAKFHQVLGTDPPYVIRQTNFDPLTGTITGYPLADGQVGVRIFNETLFNGGAITFVPQSPTPANGNYLLVAEAPLFDPSAPPNGGMLVNPSTVFNPVTISGLNPSAPALSTQVDVTAAVPAGVGSMDNVILFATFGGSILNVRPLGPVPGGASVTNAIANLPGGSSGSPFTQGSYGVSAYGWRTGGTDNVLRIGAPIGTADLRSGNATVNITMTNVTTP